MNFAAIFVLAGLCAGGTVRIRVWNPAHVPAATLAGGQSIAAEILRHAGLRVTWLDCDSPARPCRDTPTRSDLALQLLRSRPRDAEPDTAGFARLVPGCRPGCGYAAVAYPIVQAVSTAWEADPAALLGATMAHEIGHLLLGASHSHTGVMSPHFAREEIRAAERGTLLFTEAEQRELRDLVSARCR